MIIDFHTHIFPDNIASKTIAVLGDVCNSKAFTDGTLNGLKESMKEGNIDYSVVLPVVTKPSQFNSVNQFAASITGKEGIISFGGIHPETDDYKKELETIRNLGLKGIKLHPDYQKTFVDDYKMINIIEYAVKLGLIVVIHGGVDIGLPEIVHCTPKGVMNLLKKIDCSRVVIAHMGGYDMWNDVEELIVGQNIMLDISYSLGKINNDQFIRIIKKHGADKILFASDSPWDGQKEVLKAFNQLDFTKSDKDMIMYKNAQRLLDISVNN